MEDYSFWADLLVSYRASPDFIKAMWLMVPLVVAAGFFALALAASMRLLDRRDEKRGASVRTEEQQPDHEWLTAIALPPPIEHGRAEMPPARPRRR